MNYHAKMIMLGLAIGAVAAFLHISIIKSVKAEPKVKKEKVAKKVDPLTFVLKEKDKYFILLKAERPQNILAIQANLVAHLYLELGDEANYKTWIALTDLHTYGL